MFSRKGRGGGTGKGGSAGLKNKFIPSTASIAVIAIAWVEQ